MRQKLERGNCDKENKTRGDMAVFYNLIPILHT